MVTKINLKIEIIVHATEDYQKISDSLCDIFEIESSEIIKKEFSGHFGNPILMLHVQMKNKRAEGLIKKLISTISRDDVKDLLAGMDERISDSTLKYLVSIIKGSGDSSQLGGPIRIAKVTGQVAEFGILPFLSMMAYISISLGLINLFPIPLLDGGHLMFYGLEKVLGKPLSQKTQEGFFRIGLFLLLSLMFFATFNDLKDLGLF